MIRLVLFCIMTLPIIRSQCIHSQIQRHVFRGIEFYLKRDDQLRSPLAGLEGNKARKFRYLESRLMGEAGPAVPQTLVSMGGGQSNALVALSKLAKASNRELVYATRPLPKWLKDNPVGNFRIALDNKARILEVEGKVYDRLLGSNGAPAVVRELVDSDDSSGLSWEWIPQGGGCEDAAVGLRQLAGELVAFIDNEEEEKEGGKDGEKWEVVVEAGTGATAYYLWRAMRELVAGGALEGRVVVLAAPCVGDDAYCQSLLCALARQDDSDVNVNDYKLFSRGLQVLPTHNSPPSVFAQPYQRHLDLWKELCHATGGDGHFDTVYAPRAWELLLDYVSTRCDGRKIIYVHCGAAYSNRTQLARYRRMQQQQ